MKTRPLIAAAVAALSSPVWADTVDFFGYAHDSQSVHYELASPNQVKSGDADAGGFLTSLNGSPTFTSYCIDLYQTIAFTDPAYSGYTQNNAHVFTNAAAYGNLGRLFAKYFSSVDTSQEEAAFQIAVWEIAYENSGAAYNLGTGAAMFSGGTAASSGALTLAQNWLDDLGSTAVAPSIYESSDHQDIVFSPIPEPSTVSLMFAGMLGIGAIARRRVSRVAARA